jgi:hypothetical protein
MRSKSDSFEIRVEQIEAKNGKNQAFLEFWRAIDSNYVGKNHSGRLGRGDIGETPKRLTGRDLFPRISGGLSVDFKYAERIEYGIYLLNGILEKKSRLRWEVAGISTGGEKKASSVLRDPKSEFEKMTPFVIIESVFQNWIE